MDTRRRRRPRKQAKISSNHHNMNIITTSFYEEEKEKEKKEEEEVSSIEWQFIEMSEQEEDMVYRMHRLVGDRWELIAGRIPGRKAEEIERFWLMRHTRTATKDLRMN